MATDSQIGKASGESIVSASTLDYDSQKMFRHPSYNYTQQFPNQYGQAIALTSSQISSQINLPPEVFNLSRSYLQFTVNLPAVANNYIWVYADTIGAIAHIQHYCTNNQWIVDLDNANKFLKATKCNMSLTDMLTMDKSNGLSVSNTLANVVPALRNTQSIGGTANNPIPAPSDKNYIEPAYFAVGGLNTAVTINYNIPLSIYKDCFLSFDKDVYYGIVSYLKIYFDVINRICYMSTLNNNPSAGTPTAYTGANPQITNLQLLLAQESSIAVQDFVKEQFRKGLSLMVPYVQCMKVSNNGSTQSITQQLDMGFGHVLAKVYHQVYNNTEQNDTAYDCANNSTLVDGTANSVNNMKVQNFWSMLNGKRETDLTIDCTSPNNYDYMIMKNRLKGSCLPSLNAYQYNWVYCRDYADFGAEGNFKGRDDIISGIPLGSTPITWCFYGNTMTNANYQHYQWFVVYKKLMFNGNGCIVH
jgi:hypothetical protein